MVPVELSVGLRSLVEEPSLSAFCRERVGAQNKLQTLSVRSVSIHTHTHTRTHMHTPMLPSTLPETHVHFVAFAGVFIQILDKVNWSWGRADALQATRAIWRVPFSKNKQLIN